MRRTWAFGAAALVVGLGVAASARGSGPAAKVKRATRVSVVESVPVEVTAGGTPLAVDVTSLPEVTIANAPLDVRIVDGAVAPTPDTKVVTVPELDGVTLTGPLTSSEIDVDGYRTAYVFTTHGQFSGNDLRVAAQFECGGIWANQGALFGDFVLSSTNVRTQVFTQDVLGPKMRITVASSFGAFPASVPGVKVTVYLRK